MATNFHWSRASTAPLSKSVKPLVVSTRMFYFTRPSGITKKYSVTDPSMPSRLAHSG
jgi:hypothetical protein